MKHILHKYSGEGWEKSFDTEYDARQELLRHICSDCLDGVRVYLEDGEFVYDEIEPVDIHDIHSLLATACGCEFGYTEED